MKIKQIIVPPPADGERADRMIQRYFPELPERSVRAAFLRRDVKLDGRRIPRDTQVSAGQELRLYITEEEERPVLKIVYEDDQILLVNKPAGISVEPDPRGGTTLTDLCARYTARRHPEAPQPAACHRLDHQTCGLCLFAKDEKSLEILQRVFRERTMTKEYECIVRGVPKPPEAVCRAYLIKDADAARVRITDHAGPEARKIITAYETMQPGPLSRLRVHPITGRTHQIRAHLAALGHPILGDDLYGDRRLNREAGVRVLRLCAVVLQVDTGGALPQIDGREFRIMPPF